MRVIRGVGAMRLREAKGRVDEGWGVDIGIGI